MIPLAGCALASCGGRSDDQYVGEWARENVRRYVDDMGKNQIDIIEDRLVIVRDDGGFTVTSVRSVRHPHEKPTVHAESKWQAKRKGDQLQFIDGQEAYAIDATTGHLISPDGEGYYTRARHPRETTAS